MLQSRRRGYHVPLLGVIAAFFVFELGVRGIFGVPAAFFGVPALEPVPSRLFLILLTCCSIARAVGASSPVVTISMPFSQGHTAEKVRYLTAGSFHVMGNGPPVCVVGRDDREEELLMVGGIPFHRHGNGLVSWLVCLVMLESRVSLMWSMSLHCRATWNQSRQYTQDD